MTTVGPGSSGADDGDGAPPVPEEVWHRFLADSERAIRASAAPREPAARERARGRHPRPRDMRRWIRRSDDETDAVGELWQREEPPAGPKWRDLDRRARFRRAGRVAGTAAAVALAMAAWSQLSTGAGTPAGGPGGTSEQKLEVAPDGLSAVTPRPPGERSARPSSSAVRPG
ncbi:hypothetical protein [Streptomyces sp. TRM68367]|uniref:hypothetical protein n=1 Tax=Streptomyces sp. TRM68367 TaxID=2758415 RepID=UPI00165CBC8E|nr:hypothetical protein [Streptomyces sp. TRM68367]MBC9729436.1 hypothetical protein [Streptomyces sp. TRM68367]